MDLDKEELEVTKEFYKRRRNKNASRRYNKPIQ